MSLGKSFTNEEFAREVAGASSMGDRGNLETVSNVNIMVLDAPTTGRMAVVYYRNMDRELYLERLARWHSGMLLAA